MAPKRRTMSYTSSLLGRWRHQPTLFHWPSLWAMLIAFVLQMALGIFPTMLCFVLLVAADERRCPVAVGAQSMRPFCAWLVGVGLGIAGCDWMSRERRNATLDWVIWGSVAELWKFLQERSIARELGADGKLPSKKAY